jgi:hypothetical protein
MRHLLAISFAALSALALSACGDDSTNPIDLNPYFELKKGDTFTYARYDRGMDNQRIASSKTMHRWAVVETNLNYEGLLNASRIIQINYDGTGSSETGRDTLYVRSAIDGEIYIYNAVGSVLSRISVAAPLAAGIQKRWYRVSDVKTASAKEWAPIVGATQLTADGNVGGIPVSAIIKARAFHKGKQATNVEGTNYPNAFHTDHAISAIASAFGTEILNDTLTIRYDVDLDHGILREEMASDSVRMRNQSGDWETVPVGGFEMVFVSMVRAK